MRAIVNIKSSANLHTQQKSAKTMWRISVKTVGVQTDTQRHANGLQEQLGVEERRVVTSLMILMSAGML